MLVDIIMFATDNLSVYTDLSIETWKKYADQYGYTFSHYNKPYYDNLHIAWSKLKSVHCHLNSSQADYVVLVDADTIPTSFDVSIESLIDQFMLGDKQMLFQKDGNGLGEYLYFPSNLKSCFKLKKWVTPNAGFIIMRNNSEVKDFFEEWLDRAHKSPWADIPPRNQNVLNFEMLNQERYGTIIGFLEGWVINRYGGKLCRHFSSMSPEKVRSKMLPYYKKLIA